MTEVLPWIALGVVIYLLGFVFWYRVGLYVNDHMGPTLKRTVGDYQFVAGMTLVWPITMFGTGVIAFGILFGRLVARLKGFK